MQIEIFNQQQDLLIDDKSVQQIVRFILVELKTKCDEVCIHFVDKEAICDLHKIYFNDPTPTDCISFPIDNSSQDTLYSILGEVFVCPKVAIEYAHDNGIDPYEETALYVIHGILHLLGYDDIEENDEEIMRKKEEWCMNRLKEKKLMITPLYASSL